MAPRDREWLNPDGSSAVFSAPPKFLSLDCICSIGKKDPWIRSAWSEIARGPYEPVGAEIIRFNYGFLTEKYNSAHWDSQLTLESGNLCVTTSSLLGLTPVSHWSQRKIQSSGQLGDSREQREFLIEIWTFKFLLLNGIPKTTHPGRVFPALRFGHFH